VSRDVGEIVDASELPGSTARRVAVVHRMSGRTGFGHCVRNGAKDGHAADQTEIGHCGPRWCKSGSRLVEGMSSVAGERFGAHLI